MKKFLFLFFAMLLSLTTWAADFTDNSTGTTIYYNKVTGGVAVTYGDAISSPSDTNGGTEEYVGEIEIPSAVTYNGEEYTVVAIGANAFRACSDLTGVEIPKTVTELGQYAFRVSGITEITIPGSVTNMGTYLVYQCTSLESATIEEGVTTLAQYMFDGCTALETVSLPSTLETMNTYIFDGCTKLHDVVLPDGLSSIGNYSFRNCSSLTSINIPSALTTTSTYLFSGSGLTSIDLPDNITSVGAYSFQNCTSLITAKIGKNVESVGASAFAGCTALEAVYSYRADPPGAQSGSFTSVPSSCILYVPEGSVEAYKAATGWLTFSHFEEMSAELTSFTITDAGYATYYTDVEYVMPAGVTGTTVTGVTNTTSGDAEYVLTMNWEYVEGSVVPANTALVLQGEAGEYEYETSSTGAEAPTDNLLVGSTADTPTTGPNGEEEGYVFYELSDGSYGVGFYYGAEGGEAFTSEANKAWLPLSESQARGARFLGFGKGDDTTGISSVESATDGATVKGIYTVQGTRVSNMNQPGLYIVDGKKVLVK